MLQSSILMICPKLQIYLPDLDQGWVSCVCSLGSCLFGKLEMLQCRGEGWWQGLPGKGPARQRSWSKAALPRKCPLEAISFLS